MYEAIRALEQVGVLSWVNRIKRVREYASTRCNDVAGAGSPAALAVAWVLARLAGKAESVAAGRSNRERRGARNPMQRRCADRLVSPFEPTWQFRYHPPKGGQEQARTQIVLKTDERSIHLEPERE